MKHKHPQQPRAQPTLKELATAIQKAHKLEY
jgi:hypothetical protein